MPLTKLNTSFMWSKAFTKPTIDVNLAIDAYNAKENTINLGIVEGRLNAVPRAHWVTQFSEVNALETAIRREHLKFNGNAGGAAPFGPSAKKDTSPTRWLKTLFPNPPSLLGLVQEGDGLKGAQGATFKLLAGGKKLLAKTDRSTDKHSMETECQREFKIYEKVYTTAGEHRNLVKVWGWADLLLGQQHEKGFIMDLVDGVSGREGQKLLKDAWDLGIIKSADYWSSIQYIGRCHLEIIGHLRRAGWVHNDIKPENYMIDGKTGEVVVIDLGGASGIGARPGAVTVEYLAPELRGPDGKASPGAQGTIASDLFSLGATLAHATEAAHVFHGVAKPNQGVKITATPSMNTPNGTVKNPFEYGVETDFTRQLARMMNADAAEREKTIDEHASNRFLHDSILNDDQTREVLKGVISGSLKTKWEARWRAAGKTPPTLNGTDRLRVQHELQNKMRPFLKGGRYDMTAFDTAPSVADATLRTIEQRKVELREIAVLIQQANGFGIDTVAFQKIVTTKARQYAAVEQEIARLKVKK